MRLPQSDVIGFHLKEAALNPLQVISAHLDLHAQQVDVRLIAALLQGKREQRAWEQGQAVGCVCGTEKNSISYCRKTHPVPAAPH